MHSRADKSAWAKRVRFVAEAPPGAKILRAFQQPSRCFAIEETVEFSDVLLAEGASQEPADQIIVMLLSPDGSTEARKLAEKWIGSATGPSMASTVGFTISSQKVQWRPGRGMIQAPADAFDDILAAVVDFAFYEGQLRQLETTLTSYEAMAPADAARAHRIRFRDRKHWQRIGETIEILYQMRLTYARLESQFVAAPAALPRDSREFLTRLVEDAGISDRLETFSNRLEACEDLYEGANDRIADYRWYVGGHWLEIAIIAILLVEVVLMAVDVYMRHPK